MQLIGIIINTYILPIPLNGNFIAIDNYIGCITLSMVAESSFHSVVPNYKNKISKKPFHTKIKKMDATGILSPADAHINLNHHTINSI